MRFDAGWGDNKASGGGQLPLLPNGRHTGEIISACEKRLDFKKSGANPDGHSLIVTVDVHGYEPVEAITPSNFRGVIEAIARAAGLPVPAPGEDWDEERLVGKTVTIQTALHQSKKGTEYVRVERWFPSPSQPMPAATKAAPARSQAAKAHREFTANANGQDDIPF